MVDRQNVPFMMGATAGHHVTQTSSGPEREMLLQEVARVALQMFEVHLAGSPQMRLQDDIHMHPYSHIMAVLIVAIKLVYGLDPEDSEASQDRTRSAQDWQSWANAVSGSSRGPTTYPKTALEVHAFMSQVREWMPACPCIL